MALDPTINGILTLLGRMQRHKICTGTPEQARASLRALAGMRSPDSVVAVGRIQDLTIDGAAGPLPARIYRPVSDGPAPTVVFFHGGGFVLGDLDTHDNHCRWLCHQVGAVVVSVDYRLAPEAPFPAAVQDCLAATRWVAGRLPVLGGDPLRMGVAGDSAGGNLAAVVAQASRTAGEPDVAAQLLIYPIVDPAAAEGTYPSRLENGDDYFLTLEDMRWFGRCYLGAGSSSEPPTDSVLNSPQLSPMRGELDGLPPAVVVTMEYDPLRDEGEAYAAAMAAAGVPVILHRFDGLIHGTFELPLLPAAGVAAIRTTCASFRELLKG